MVVQAQYEWKVDQLQQHASGQQQECSHLKAQLQAAQKVSHAVTLPLPSHWSLLLPPTCMPKNPFTAHLHARSCFCN